MPRDRENSNPPLPEREALRSLLYCLGCNWVNKFSQHCPTLEGWREEEQVSPAQCSLLSFTLLCYQVLPLHQWIWPLSVSLELTSLYITQAQFRLVQRIFSYQGNVGRRNAGQIQALMLGSNPCFYSCVSAYVSAHAVAVRKAPGILPTDPWRKRWHMRLYLTFSLDSNAV